MKIHKNEGVSLEIGFNVKFECWTKNCVIVYFFDKKLYVFSRPHIFFLQVFIWYFHQQRYSRLSLPLFLCLHYHVLVWKFIDFDYWQITIFVSFFHLKIIRVEKLSFSIKFDYKIFYFIDNVIWVSMYSRHLKF